jgi:4-amino-4-deoxy-L-arabinose transferase-like glycosyltransferase
MNGTNARWTSYFKERSFLVFMLLLVSLVNWRSRSLDVPFYWDEAWVYAPAVQAMIDNGPSLLPNAIPVELSRGHPLLFHATTALWGLVFGHGALALHAFALVVAVVLLGVVYLTTRSLTNGPIALAAAALVVGHEGFLAQSGLLLPELFLGLWMVLAVHAAAVGRWAWYALFGSLALLTKESALALVAGTIAWATITCIRSGAERHWKVLLAACVPALVLGAFYAIQFGMHGWVFFPEHVDLISLTWRDMAYKARLIFTVLFEEQGRLPLGFAFTMIPILLLNAVPLWRRLVSIVLCVAVIKALWGRWPLPFIPEPLSSLLLLVPLVLLYPVQLNLEEDSAPRRWMLLSWLVFIAFWSLSAMNFYTDRYLMPLVPLLMVGGAVTLFTLNQRGPSWLPVSILGCCAILQGLSIGADQKVGDTRLSYLDAIACDLALVDHVNALGASSGTITADEMHAFYLTRPEAGYQSAVLNLSVTSPIDPERSDLVVLSSTSAGSAIELLDSLGWVPSFRSEQGHAWVEVRRRPVSR